MRAALRAWGKREHDGFCSYSYAVAGIKVKLIQQGSVPAMVVGSQLLLLAGREARGELGVLSNQSGKKRDGGDDCDG